MAKKVMTIGARMTSGNAMIIEKTNLILTYPDWMSIMKIEAGIITNLGRVSYRFYLLYVPCFSLFFAVSKSFFVKEAK